MTQIRFSFYFISSTCLFLGFLLSVFLALHSPATDSRLFNLIYSRKYRLLDVITFYSIEPKYWIPYYNFVLIILFTAFGNKFSKVILGILILFFIVYFLSDWSANLGLADKAHFTSGNLNADEINRFKSSGRFSYHHITMVFAMAAYLYIVLPNTYRWFKLLLFACGLLITFSCIYTGAILPFSALTACFIGVIPACLISPFYIQKLIINQSEYAQRR